MPFVKCLNCGKVFKVSSSKYKEGRGKFCSRKCMIEYHYDILICKNCGKIFKREKRRQGRQNLVFCSRACKIEYYKQNYGNHIDLTQELLDYLNGLLLSDGCLDGHHKSSACYRQRFSEKFREWTLKIQKDLKTFGMESKIYTTASKIRGKVFSTILLKTKYYKELKILWSEWYIPQQNRNIKIAPKTIELSPVTVLNWYLGDGSLHIATKKESSKTYYNPRIFLCTNNFTKEDVLYLSHKLNDTIGIESKVIPHTQQKTRYMIFIGKKADVRKFLDYIGDPPVKCFEYKWL